MNTEEQKGFAIVCAGVAIGSAIATYILMKDIQETKIADLQRRAVEQINIRNEVLQWLANEAPQQNLTAHEVQVQFEEKIRFINAASGMLLPSARKR